MESVDILYLFLTDIRKNRKLYVGEKSINALYMCIIGFLECQKRLADKNDCFMDDFNEFVSSKYLINTDHNWAELIVFFNPNIDDQWNEFWKFFDEYVEQSLFGKNVQTTH